jgi:hypothetical protein
MIPWARISSAIYSVKFSLSLSLSLSLSSSSLPFPLPSISFGFAFFPAAFCFASWVCVYCVVPLLDPTVTETTSCWMDWIGLDWIGLIQFSAACFSYSSLPVWIFVITVGRGDGKCCWWLAWRCDVDSVHYFGGEFFFLFFVLWFLEHQFLLSFFPFFLFLKTSMSI